MFYSQMRLFSSRYTRHFTLIIILAVFSLWSAQAQNDDTLTCNTGEFALAAHLEEGAFLRGRQLWQDALFHYTCAIGISSDMPEAYTGRSLIYMAQGNYQDAVDDLTIAVALTQDDAGIHNNMGWALHKLQRYDDALVSLSRAIELDAEYAIAFNNRGVVHRALGMLDEAIDDYQAAADYGHPVEHAPYMNLGTLYLQEYGDKNNAVRWYTQAARTSPNEAILQKILGDTLRDNGDLSGAEKAYRVYIQLENDTSPEVLAYLQQHEFTRFYLPMGSLISLLALAVSYIVWRIWQKRRKPASFTPPADYRPVKLSRLITPAENQQDS